ncbi:protein NTM1-like 9 isoform X1 [Prunus avium]|uniref:Protein NTM1-like 9 isoform X1 n=1 Tax=Prunus avium TaxID=42229 RepID=A0A6P5T629_PRUAV|nr:protein NTM1-like 9 isoform X1 [Prunus avium]XP_021822627.1 protein NTM1-like 9 isoform X1 [Prunus avium]
MSSISSTTMEEGDAVPVVLPGFRFYPTEEVLVGYYLKKKIEGKDSNFRHIIPEIDVCKHEPCDVPAFFEEPDFPDHEMEWFFFSQPDYKYTNSTRCNRATDQGFYKITGKVREIKARRSKAVIGKKRTLTFYEGRVPKAKKTNWIMHEYYLTNTELAQLGPNPNQQRDFVLCRLKNKSANYKKVKADSGSGSGGCIASNSEDDQAAATDMISEPLEHLASQEVGDVLNGNGDHDECTESPNGTGLIDNNDTSTCDDDEIDTWIFYDFDNQAACDLFQEYCAEPGENLDSPLPPPQPPLPPLPQDYCSSTQQSSLYTNQGNVPYVYDGECNRQQSPIGDRNSYLSHKNNMSMNNQIEPVSNITYGVQNQATSESNSEVYNNSTNDFKEPGSNITYNCNNGAPDERILEAVKFQGDGPKENLGSRFDPFQLQDFTLLSPMNSELGDFEHGNKLYWHAMSCNL